MEEATAPELCRRIRAERKRLKDEWAAAHPGDRGNPYTQEAMAHKLELSLKAYRAYEADREPSRPRTREIARALDLPEDHFDQGSLDALRAEVSELRGLVELVLEEVRARSA
jgi:transcriptional regulator with XRE-family HTH domain